MTLLIKNVLILGGGQKFPEERDVFVTGDKISAIGDLSNKKADEVIDGQGAYLSPGFIDVNTDSDHYLSLLDYPEQEDFLRQGVTTIIGGMCGSSLAPLIYGSLESVQKWGDIRKVNVNWHSLAEFLDTLGKKPLGVNFATLVGHSTVRRAIIGDRLRELTKGELAVFGNALRNALEEGGFGLSTGLGYVHSYRTPYSEIKFLAEIVRGCNGVYATHLRKTDSEIGESVDETIKIAEEVGVKTQISHFRPILGAEKYYEEAFRKIESLPTAVNLNFDLDPYDVSVLAVYTFLPLWVKTGGREVMLQNLKDEWLRPRIEKDFPKINPDAFVVAQAPGNDSIVGRSLGELTKIYNLVDYQSALAKLMVTTELRAVIFYKNINEKVAARALKAKRSFIASNAASFGESKERRLKPERAVSTFTKFLKMVMAEKSMKLEEAVKKITAEPAEKFNLTRRGAVKEGYFADLALFSVNNAEGGDSNVEIKFVAVNGVPALINGAASGKLAGRALRRGK